MKASTACNSALVGKRKSGLVLVLFRVRVRGKCCMTAPVANVCRSGILPLNPKGAVRLRFNVCGDFRKTGGVGGKPSIFSSIRPRPCGKFVTSLLVRIRLGLSRPSTEEDSGCARLPAPKPAIVAEQE